jgi:KDO2-lipid IV(A) lauroyltransferase
MRENLQTAFPALSNADYSRLNRESLRHFCDIFMEMIKSLSLSKNAMRKRFICENVEEMNAFAKAGKSVIVMMGHQASYEWTMVLSDQLLHEGYAVYKPLKNQYFNRLIKNIRRKFGTTLVAMKEARNLVEKMQKEPSFFAFVADQAPKPLNAKYFTLFFNRPTAVFMGSEQLARKNNLPVVYLQVNKLKRGYYSARFEVITENAQRTSPWEITDSFFNKLESHIASQPAYYLWSHKRWKSTLENTTRNVELSPRVQQ